MEDKEIFFEQYKLFVKTAEKVSDRRQSSNKYFLTLNSFLLGLTGYLSSIAIQLWHIVIVFTAILICLLWLLILKSFRGLNSGKFKVIHKLEEKLPTKLFRDEWDYLKHGKNSVVYLKLSVIEQGVPIVFMMLYIIIIVLMLI